MSFILDALKKLEREKKTQEPGVVMVGPVPWGESDRSRRGRGPILAGVVLAVAFAGALLWLRSGADPSPVPSGDDGSAAPAASSEGTPAVATPAVPDARPSVPPAAGSAPPVPRNLRLPGAETTRPVAVEAPPPAADTVAPTTAAGSDAAPSREPTFFADEAEPATPVDDTELEVPVEEIEPAVGSSPMPEFHLTAISSRDGRPIALLNDRLVREGDRFGDLLVIRIGESEVEIEVKGERKTIGF